MKPKIALTWLGGCGGCDEAFIDLDVDLPAAAEQMQIVFWPMAVDASYADLEAMADGDIQAAFINGAVRSEAHVNLAGLLRRKSRVVFAVGACAHLGGIPGLANVSTPLKMLEQVYGQTQARQVDTAPAGPPRLLDKVLPLNRIIPVDYTIPGCPPLPAQMQQALAMVQQQEYPVDDPVLADPAPLCLSCPRADSRPQTLRIKSFRRLYNAFWDEQTCFLKQDLVCMGPLTRGGCRARCIGGNSPCRGCYGPLDANTDQGARAVAFFASAIQARSPEEMAAGIAEMVDPAGSFHHFSLAASAIRPKAKRS